LGFARVGGVTFGLRSSLSVHISRTCSEHRYKGFLIAIVATGAVPLRHEVTDPRIIWHGTGARGGTFEGTSLICARRHRDEERLALNSVPLNRFGGSVVRSNQHGNIAGFLLCFWANSLSCVLTKRW
jgi:hypothetical protein